MPPERITEDNRRVQLVRTATSTHYRSYVGYGDIALSDRADDKEFHRVRDWPLVVHPGMDLHITVMQDYQLLIDGRPIRFEEAADVLAYLGPYLDLPQTTDGSYLVAFRTLPTKVRCADDEWVMDVPYAAWPAGVGFAVPDEFPVDDDSLY